MYLFKKKMPTTMLDVDTYTKFAPFLLSTIENTHLGHFTSTSTHTCTPLALVAITLDRSSSTCPYNTHMHTLIYKCLGVY